MRVAPTGTVPVVLTTPRRTLRDVLRMGTVPAGVMGVGAGVTGAGGLDGVTGLVADDAPEVPTPLVAVTVNVYAVPPVSPVTVHEVAPVVMHVRPPGRAVTV